VLRVHGSLRLLCVVGRASPDLVLKQHTVLTKMLARLAKDFLTRRETPAAVAAAATAAAAAPATTAATASAAAALAAAASAAAPTAEELLLPALKLTIKLGAQKLPEVTYI